MFDLPNPVGMYESAVTSGLEREAALDLMGMGLSATVTFLWTLATLPMLGKALSQQALAMKVSICEMDLYKQGKLKFTYPKSMDNPDLNAQFETSFIQK